MKNIKNLDLLIEKTIGMSQEELNKVLECIKNMKTIQITNIDYSGNDFCGEIDSDESSNIISNQPANLSISFQSYEGWSSDVKDIVSDFCYDNGILEPTSFDFNLAD